MERRPEARRLDNSLDRDHHFSRSILKLQVRHPVGLHRRPFPVQEVVVSLCHIAQGLVFFSAAHQGPEFKHAFLKLV